MPKLGQSEYLGVAEAANILGVSRSGVRRYADAGILRCVRHPLNSYRLYKKADVRALLKKFEAAERS